jgi:hypothetical protein
MDMPLIVDIDYPPTYVVFMTLCHLAGFRWHAFPEKSVWQVYVRYKGLGFCLADWKRGSWSVRGAEDSAAYRRCAEELRSKVASAARLAEKAVESSFAKEVERGNFYVDNSYYRVRPAYKYFRQRVRKLTEERDTAARAWRDADAQGTMGSTSPPERDARLHWLEHRVNYLGRWQKRLSQAAAPMVVFFFSYTEIIFDILFAFEETRTMSFGEFRGRHWADRFKQVLPASKDAHLHRTYQSLLDIKRVLRDPLVHGYGCEEALLVPIPHFGLVPVSYAPWAKRFYLPYIAVREESVPRTVEAFDGLDAWLEADFMGEFALLYARSGFPIPLQEDRLNEIRSWMSSREAFQEALQKEAELQDALQDQYP